MILGRETINQLVEHPKPPLEGYVIVYGYGNSIWMMRSNGEKYDLLNPGSGGGGTIASIRQDVTSLTAGEWERVEFDEAMPDANYTISPLQGTTTNGSQVPVKIKNLTTDYFDVWAARSCTFRWTVIKALEI